MRKGGSEMVSVIAGGPYLAIPGEGLVKALGEVPVCDCCEDSVHGVVIKLLDGDDVEMTREASGDVIPPSTRRTHGRHEQLEVKADQQCILSSAIREYLRRLGSH